MKIDDFWSLSVSEIIDYIEAANSRETADFKRSIVTQFVQANAIASRIAIVFTEKKKRREEAVLQPWDVWPELFIDEREEVEKAQEEKAQEMHKRQMELFAARWNAKRKNDAGQERNL